MTWTQFEKIFVTARPYILGIIPSPRHMTTDECFPRPSFDSQPRYVRMSQWHCLFRPDCVSADDVDIDAALDGHSANVLSLSCLIPRPLRLCTYRVSSFQVPYINIQMIASCEFQSDLIFVNLWSSTFNVQRSTLVHKGCCWIPHIILLAYSGVLCVSFHHPCPTRKCSYSRAHNLLTHAQSSQGAGTAAIVHHSCSYKLHSMCVNNRSWLPFADRRYLLFRSYPPHWFPDFIL